MSVNKWIKSRLNTNKANAPKAKEAPLKPLSEIIKEEVELLKSNHENHLNTLAGNHEEEQASDVKSTYHYVNSDTHQGHQKAIHDPSFKVELDPDINKGISPKVIHKVDDDHFMTKPYYSKKEKEIPLSGWSSMTTSNLYKAAGLKDLIENINTSMVSISQSKKIPVTVHKFTKNYTNAADLTRAAPDLTTKVDPEEKTLPMGTTPQPNLTEREYQNLNSINPLQARQIGVMDFLTGNYDRHGNNLLVSNDKKEDFRDLLAIDHDRAFTYLPVSSPYDEYTKSAMTRILGDSGSQKNDDHYNSLAVWWNDNKHAIYKEMNRNLNEIENHQLRKYVRRNFDQRYQLISDWADMYPTTNKGFFEKDTGSIITHHPLGMTDSDSVKKLKESLPKNKTVAVDMLIDQMKKPRSEYSPAQFHAIQSVASNLIPGLPESDLVRFFSTIDPGERIKSFKNDVLMDMKRNLDKNYAKIKKLLDINSELPLDSKFLNPFWDLHLNRILSQYKKERL